MIVYAEPKPRKKLNEITVPHHEDFEHGLADECFYPVLTVGQQEADTAC